MTVCPKDRRRRVRRASRLAGWMAHLPACKLLYPLYLAAQLDLVETVHASAALPPVLDGLSIAYLSDIHYGALCSEARVRDAVRRINALNPDLVILGGDYGEDLAGAVDFFHLMPDFRAKYGVFAVAGNHDRSVPGSDPEPLKAAMRGAGITPLINDAALLTRTGHTLALAGIDDYYNGNPDYARVRSQCAGADYVILLPHTPDAVPEALAGGKWFHLALCGHTHGGQVRVLGVPLLSSSEYRRRFLSGFMQYDGVQMLVSNGVGTSGLPVRLGARPQIHLITLKVGKIM